MVSKDHQSRARRTGEDSFDAGTLESPAAFGSYELIGKVGRGGMANVYRGRRHDDPTELLAIKCMRTSLADKDRFVEMFEREGQLALLLDHPSIVRTVDVGRAEGRFFIAMEYIPGHDLNELLRACRDQRLRLPVPHGLYVGSAIARALDYAHQLHGVQGRPLNVVNRDVSPANVRISYDGEVKLLDFGIAQALIQATSEIGVLKGKFAYMSPEQIRGLPLDRRSDIYSLGLVLHEMLSCERVFSEESEFDLMEQVRAGKIRPPSAINKRVTPELDAIVMRALHRDPQERYQRAGALASDLEQLLEHYRFQRGELGGFLRRLFPEAHREELEMLGSSTLDDLAVTKPLPVPDSGEVLSASQSPPREGARDRPVDPAIERRALLAAADEQHANHGGPRARTSPWLSPGVLVPLGLLLLGAAAALLLLAR